MRKDLFTILFVSILVVRATLAVAQDRASPTGPEILPVPEDEMTGMNYSYDGPVWEGGPPPDSWGAPVYGAPYRPGHWSVKAEGLVMWSHAMRLPKLVTTSPDNTLQTAAGVLGPDGSDTLNTTTLFGGEREDNPFTGGGRIQFAYWSDDAETLGIVGNFFAVDAEDISFNAASPGLPILARPFFDAETGAEQQSSSLLAFPDVWSGSIDIEASSEVLGSEVYLQETLYNCNGHRLDFIYGYRFLHLDEQLRINDRIVAGNAGPIAQGSVIATTDLFDTENTFHGGQLGFAWKVRQRRWTWDTVFKLALGSVNQEVVINGSTTTQNAVSQQISNFTGGFLALDSNIGSFEESRFAVIPELQTGISYEFRCNWKWSIAYNFIYLSDAVRPGDQIDPLLNLSQASNGNLNGPARPMPIFRDADFWLQGLTFGLEYRH